MIAAERQLLRIRLAAQEIWPPDPGGDAVSVVSNLLALQAQDLLGSFWSIGVRSLGVVEHDVEAAIAERHLIRTWPMRGTLHLVSADDAHWMLDLMAPRALAAAAGMERRLGIDDTAVRRAIHAAERAFADQPVIRRQDLFAIWSAAGIKVGGVLATRLVWNLAHRKLLACGPRAGKQQTLVWLPSWLPAPPPIDRQAAIAELIIRYVDGHGAVSERDLAWWSGLTLTELRAVAGELPLESCTVNGTSYWLAEIEPPADTSVHLLPGFDEYLLGYSDRSLQLAAEHTPHIVPGNNGMFMPTIIIDGRVAGTWKRTIRSRRVEISLKPFVPLRKAQIEQLHQRAEEFGAFLGEPTTGRPVTVLLEDQS